MSKEAINPKAVKKESIDLMWKTASVLYALLLVKLIVFKYPTEMMCHIVEEWNPECIRNGIKQANFTPFRTIDMYIRYWDFSGLRSFENLIGNVIAFIPLGFILPRAWRWCRNFLVTLGYGLTFVLGIELFQLISNFGSFDIDDIILNCTGVICGHLLYLPVAIILRKKGHDF